MKNVSLTLIGLLTPVLSGIPDAFPYPVTMRPLESRFLGFSAVSTGHPSFTGAPRNRVSRFPGHGQDRNRAKRLPG